MITNIFLDNDIINENVEDIINKFNFFFQKHKNKLRKPLVNYYLINKYDDDDINLLKKDNYLLYDKKKISLFLIGKKVKDCTILIG